MILPQRLSRLAFLGFTRLVFTPLAVAPLAIAPLACGSDMKSEADLKADIVVSMHALVLAEITALHQAAQDLQNAAPSTFLQGWDVTQDSGAAIANMKVAWTRTRIHWERAEGVIEPMFAMLDEAMDSRYEDMVMALGAAGDPDPFDGEGMIGMHAVERILYAPGPQSVADYEATLGMPPGYQPAAWPSSDEQAAEFKNGLCQRLVTDSQDLLDRWKTVSIDLGVVFRGLTGLMSAQAEKVNLAGMNLAESRYSQTTMADLRSNLSGTQDFYDLFVPWLDTKPYGMTLNTKASAAFMRLGDSYGKVSGDAVPTPPANWSMPPSAAALNSPFGELYTAIGNEVDPSYSGSAVDVMNLIAAALGLPPYSPN